MKDVDLEKLKKDIRNLQISSILQGIAIAILAIAGIISAFK